jgi:D-3-phosphoglycerate dehydrogenase
MGVTSPKVLITEGMPFVDEEVRMLEPYAAVEVATSTKEEHLLRLVGDVDVIMVVYGRITSRIMESASRLKGIVRYGIGIDNIDVEAASKRRIPVANVPEYAIDTVADHTMALLLALARRLLHADRAMRSRRWGVWASPSMEYRGIDLSGKTLGIIGLGKIGRAVARRAFSFGMKISAYDPYVSAEDSIKLNIEPVPMGELLSKSDFVTIHAPLTNETRYLIGQNELAAMRSTSFLINTSRGSLVDTKALAKALKEGAIAGAALDVFPREPPSPNDELLDLNNIILTPHIAWYTAEAVRRLEMTAVENTIQILQGRRPKTVVNSQIYNSAQ